MSPGSDATPGIRLATTPADIAAVRALFLDYLAFVENFLGASLDFQGTQVEFRDFPKTYDALLLATLGDAPVGACAVKPLKADGGGAACELKRLFVRAEGRGHALGRRLTQAAVARARTLGYTRMLLDTNAGLVHANAIYEALGFADIPAYYDNPLGDSSRYMALDLQV